MFDAPRLTHLRVSNFRSLGDVDIEFGPLTVLVGPNGVGKSNVVDALRFVRDITTRGLAQAILDREGFAAVRRRSSGRPRVVSVEIGMEQGDVAFTWAFSLDGGREDEFRVRHEHLEVLSRGRVSEVLRRKNDSMIEGNLYHGVSFRLISDKLFLHDHIAVLNDDINKDEDQWYGLAIEINYLLKLPNFYNIHADALREPQRVVSEAPFNEDGSNLAAVLRRIRNNAQESTLTLRQALGRLVEGVSNYRIVNAGGYLVTELEYEGEDGKGRRMPLAAESDGTLRLLGILAALYQTPPRPIIVLEEPEANIHPGALGVLAEVIQEASTRSQIILTTHSPDLIDRLDVDALRIVDKQDGATVVGPVRAAQREAVRQRLFSPGELMRMEGLEREGA